ncbi:nuclear transport factor 2 family protein [Pseudomonas sp. X10]
MHRDIARQQIIDLENARCRALVNADLSALQTLIDDDLVHVHATGTVDDKPAYLALVENAITFLRAERHDLDVRVYGDLAVATGRLLQTIELRASAERREMDVITTQVWRRWQDGWRQLSFHATNR